MRLHELATACYAFNALTPFNDALSDFRESTTPAPDLRRQEHRAKLLRFLRQWGCRHLALEHEESQSEALRTWYSEWTAELPPKDVKAWELSDDQLDRAADAYGALASTPTHYSQTVRGKRLVTIGPTAAGKVLFVLRPHAFAPPDDATRKNMKRLGLAASYRGIIGWVRDECQDLADQCKQHGLALDDLPKTLDRPQDTVVHLFQEYMWVVFSQEVVLPNAETMQRWASWAADGRLSRRSR